MSIIKKSLEYIKKYGFAVVLDRVKENSYIRKNPSDYDNYRKLMDCHEGHKLDYNPKVTVIVHNGGSKTIESVENQIYTNIQLLNIFEETKAKSFNKGLTLADGEYVSFLNSEDILEKNAVYEMVKCLNKKMCSMVYCDDDTISGEKYVNPFFKPCFSPHTLLSFCYIGFSIFDCDKAKNVGFNCDYKDEEYYDFLLKYTNENKDISKVDRVLCHKKEHIENIEEIRTIKQSILMTRNIRATVDEGGNIVFKPDEELVSIVIPSKDNVNMLKTCINSIVENTEYGNYEIIVVDNGSNDENSKSYVDIISKVNGKYIYEKMDFNFSKMCNIGAENSQGKYILFLNDDIEVTDSKWLTEIVGYCQLPEIGAVGAKLLYPDTKNIQHCGVINIQNGPVHCFGNMPDGDYYFGRTSLPYNFSAVTGACLMIKKKDFCGFDEDFAVAYNDIDLCFSLLEKGLYNVCLNNISLLHYESVSRGDDRKNEEKLLRLYRERMKLDNKYRNYISNDLYYNTNLTQHKADFSIEVINRVFASKPFKQIKNVDRYIDSDVEYAVEYIHYRDYITIGGYAYKEIGVYCKINLLLFTDENALVFETDIEQRFDLAKLKNKNIPLCGFKCRIDNEIVDKGQYEIGILLTSTIGAKHVVRTGYTIDITV
jgi:GT2 family glycosyltransferase